MLMNDIVDYIDTEIPPKLIQTLSVMDKRELIKAVVVAYLKLIKATLLGGCKFTIRGIGRLEPCIRHIGAKRNPFTGLVCIARESKSIRFKISRKLKQTNEIQ